MENESQKRFTKEEVFADLEKKWEEYDKEKILEPSREVKFIIEEQLPEWDETQKKLLEISAAIYEKVLEKQQKSLLGKSEALDDKAIEELNSYLKALELTFDDPKFLKRYEFSAAFENLEQFRKYLKRIQESSYEQPLFEAWLNLHQRISAFNFDRCVARVKNFNEKQNVVSAWQSIANVIEQHYPPIYLVPKSSKAEQPAQKQEKDFREKWLIGGPILEPSPETENIAKILKDFVQKNGKRVMKDYLETPLQISPEETYFVVLRDRITEEGLSEKSANQIIDIIRCDKEINPIVPLIDPSRINIDLNGKIVFYWPEANHLLEKNDPRHPDQFSKTKFNEFIGKLINKGKLA